MSMRLYLVQRATAMLMVPLIVGHLVIIFYATAQGVTAADILGRTQGSLGWGLYYGVFVMLAAAHGAIGVRTIAAEWARLEGAALEIVMWGFGVVLAAIGLRAVVAVVFPGSLA